MIDVAADVAAVAAVDVAGKVAVETSREAGYEAAFLSLMDALACAFKALQDPACTGLLGALVPGATMAFGARVPGTSYQLDPVHAAFNIGTMVGWQGHCDEAFGRDCGHLTDNLGAVLAVADYRSRKAIAEGVQPPTVREMFTALIHAHERAAHEWQRSMRELDAAMPGRTAPAKADAWARCGLTRIASADAAAALLGGTDAQIMSAREFARCETSPRGMAGAMRGLDGHERWQLGDATGRGVRLALVALASRPSPCRPDQAAINDLRLSGGMVGCEPGWSSFDSNSGPIAGVASRIHDRFAASVATHFPTGQATRLVALFADRTRLEALPVNELVSMTVHN